MIDWYIEGVEFGVCNCDYSCPCQFESLPDKGHCSGFEAVRIDKGHFGATDLKGLHAALVYAWPGPIFKGGGAIQAIIDERATEEQRKALATVLYGGETKEAATHWWVFHAMSSKVHPPIFKPIVFEADIDKRVGKVRVPGVLEASGRPIKSPATGAEHRVRIDIPGGIEFELAEIGSGTLKTTGAIPLDLANTYGQFNKLRHSGAGVVH
jgi:hypothetical protein